MADDRVTLAHELIENVGDAFEQHRQQVDQAAYDERSGRWTKEPLDRQADVEDFARRPDVQAKLQKAVELAGDVVAEAQGRVSEVKATLIPERDMAGQVAAQRQWARSERLLDSAKTDGERAAMARKLLENASSPAELATLLEEVAPYMQAHGLPVSHLDQVVAQRVPELAYARQNLRQAEKYLTITKANAAQQQRMLQTGHRATHLVDPAKVR